MGCNLKIFLLLILITKISFSNNLDTINKNCKEIDLFLKLPSIKKVDIFYNDCVDNIYTYKSYIDSTLLTSLVKKNINLTTLNFDKIDADSTVFYNLDSTIINLDISLKDDGNFYNDKNYMLNFRELLLSGISSKNFKKLQKSIDTTFIKYDINYKKISVKFYRKDKEKAINLIFDILYNSVFSSVNIDFEIKNDDTNFDVFYKSCVFKEGNKMLINHKETVMSNILFYKKYWTNDNIYISIKGIIDDKEINNLLNKNINHRYSKKKKSKSKASKRNKSKGKVKVEESIIEQQGTLLKFLTNNKIKNPKIIISSFSDETPTKKEKYVSKIYSKILNDLYSEENNQIFLDFENNSKGIIFSCQSCGDVSNIITHIENILKKIETEGFYDEINEKLLKKYLYYYKNDSLLFTKKYQLSFFNKFIFTKNLRIFVEGNSIELFPKLEAKGYNINFINNKGEDIPKPQIILPLERNINITDVINKYFKYLGGINNIYDINSLEKKGITTINKKKMYMSYKFKSPHKFSQTISTKNKKVYYKKIFSSSKGYLIYGDKKHIYDKKEIRTLRNKKWIFPVSNYSNAEKLNLINKEPVKGIWCYKLEYKLIDEELRYYYISTINGRLLREDIYDKDNKLNSYIMYSDYREVDNIKFPFNEEVYNSSNKKIMSTKINQIKVNIDLKNKDFN